MKEEYSALLKRNKERINSLRKRVYEDKSTSIEEIKTETSFKETLNILYKLLLNREYDDGGLNHYSDLYLRTKDFKYIINDLFNCDERKTHTINNISLKYNVAALVFEAYEILVNRGPSALDLSNWRDLISNDSKNIEKLLFGLFNERLHRKEVIKNNVCSNKKNSCNILGTSEYFDNEKWDSYVKKDKKKSKVRHLNNAFKINNNEKVSIITSMYKGGKYIDKFLQNITNSNHFNSCELVIVDANSPENEYKAIQEYQKKYKNINYIRIDEIIPIYKAWNIAIRESTGEFITNANLDDLRRSDSFTYQAAVLSSLSFVDIVYQDFYYSFDHNLTFDEVAAIGIKSNLPIVTKNNILSLNPPHNAPMWRRKLHNELGLFDERYESAGDYEFWCKCALNNKLFYKTNDPHVVYYQNPEGLSTRPDSKGAVESNRITLEYSSKLLSGSILMNNNDYSEHLEYSGKLLSDRYLDAHRAFISICKK